MRIKGRLTGTGWIAGVVAVGMLLVVMVGAGSAWAAAPLWRVTAVTAPTSLPAGGEGEIVVQATNLGAGPVEVAGNPVTLGVKLPAGLTAIAVNSQFNGFLNTSYEEFGCSLAALTCTYDGETSGHAGGISPLVLGAVQPYFGLEMVVTVKVGAVPAGSGYEAVVSGGSALSVSVRRPVVVGGGGTPFGVEDYELDTANEDGSPATQAGSHPFQLTSTVMLNASEQRNTGGIEGEVLELRSRLRW